MADDQAQTILAPAQADNSVKADAWQAFKDSANEREFGVRLQGMNLPQQVKADLWEAKRSAAPKLSKEQQSIAQAPNPITQARASLPQPQFTSPTDQLRGTLANAQDSPGYNEYMRQAGQLPAVVASTMATGGLFPSIQGAGLLKNIPSLVQRATTTGAAAGVGSIVGGANPQEAATNAIGGAVGQPISEGFSPLTKWIFASKTAGAKLLQQASAKVGNATVELSAQTNELVDEIVRNEKLAGKPVKAVTDLLRRLGPAPGQAAEAVPGPLTYDEGRILYSNLGTELATKGDNALQGRVKDLAYKFLGSLGRDVQKTAEAGGAGLEHAQGMAEYATASARNRALVKAGKVAGIGGAGYMAEQAIRKGIQAVKP
jgi:polyhydroxyalkanoate synthesis regulator phasin